MLKKTQRLTTAQFNEYFKSGKVVNSDCFQLRYSPSPSFHAAMVVGKKVSKKAVDRNRLRRAMYNRFYQHKQREQLSGVFICVAKPAARSLSKLELTQAINEIIGLALKKR